MHFDLTEVFIGARKSMMFISQISGIVFAFLLKKSCSKNSFDF